MPLDSEKIITHYDLYKSYGEFNFLFEDTIQEYRLLIIAVIRMSYEYFEEEDDEQNELPYSKQDRLLKIMMNNMGAKELVENCKACFCDFLNNQKGKHGSYIFRWFEEEIHISQESYDFAMAVFKKTLQLIELRNVVIHSHYSESLSIPEMRRDNLSGEKDIRSGKGYELRNFTFEVKQLEEINDQIQALQFMLFKIKNLLFSTEEQKENYTEELEQLKGINFGIKFNE